MRRMRSGNKRGPGPKSARSVRPKAKSTAGRSSVFRQRGVVRARQAKAELKHVKWTDVEMERLSPLLERQFVVGLNTMLARLLLKQGCIVPEHSHVNEQVTYVLEGALKFSIDGRDIVVRTGEVLTIPPNMPHKAEAIVDTVDIDIFNPPRADWISKDDSYLRGGGTPPSTRR